QSTLTNARLEQAEMIEALMVRIRQLEMEVESKTVENAHLKTQLESAKVQDNLKEESLVPNGMDLQDEVS
ncbi:hypothetical protein PENTCL1PPCAC_23252, partial [Pristionchus entomophagus]